jgi:chemotaxis signal transduction protein
MSELVLAVSTQHASHLLPLDIVVEVIDGLVVGPAPRPSAIQAGIAIHRGHPLPLYSLDVVLGLVAREARNWEDREWGGYVVARILGHRCVLGVARIEGLVRAPDPAAVLDLAGRLAARLPALESGASLEAPKPPAAARYLLAQIGGNPCALPVKSIERVQAGCRMVRAVGAEGMVLIGVGTVEGRVLPVVDLRALLGFPGAAAPAGYVVAATADIGRLILAVDRITGLRDIVDLTLDLPPEGAPSCIIAVADYGRTWILSPSLVTIAPDLAP